MRKGGEALPAPPALYIHSLCPRAVTPLDTHSVFRRYHAPCGREKPHQISRRRQVLATELPRDQCTPRQRINASASTRYLPRIFRAPSAHRDTSVDHGARYRAGLFKCPVQYVSSSEVSFVIHFAQAAGLFSSSRGGYRTYTSFCAKEANEGLLWGLGYTAPVVGPNRRTPCPRMICVRVCTIGPMEGS